MKKTVKALAVALTLILTLAAVAIFTLADNSTPATEQASAEPTAPEIVSKNISYSSYLHILYAIPTDSVDEGYTPYIELYSTDPKEGGEPKKTVTAFGVESLSAITGEARDYYVFSSYGISPKNMTAELYAIPYASDENGNTVKGKTVKYSVAEYCYERLCSDGFALVTDEFSADYLRRSLYEALLEYGLTAYTVLGSEYTSPEAFSYFSVFGAKDGQPTDSLKPGDTITLTYDPTVIPKDYLFGGWRVVSYTPDGKISEQITECDSVTVSAAFGGVSVSAIYKKDPVIARAEQIAEQQIIDNEIKAAQWVALEEAFVSNLGYTEENAHEVTDAIKLLYTLYGPEMVTWVASLYSKGYMDLENGIWAGGFYASTAGRDAYGYGPDLQCTVQLLRFLKTSGVIDNQKEDIPLWMQHQMVYFAKSLQHENGYFYHPQWGKELTDTKISRRGRDLGWGVTLLKDFGEKPVYDTPSGVAGDGQSADEYLESLGLTKELYPVSDASLTSPLGASVTEMVSMAVYAAAETDDGTAYLKSHTAFINYLLTYIEPGMRTNQYSTGNTINATNGQIGNYSNILGAYTYTAGDEATTKGATAEDYKRFDGMTMKEMILEVLLTNVNPKTGLYGGYQEDGSWLGKETLNFSHSNGFFKVISVINSWGGVYPYAALAADSLITNLVNENLPSTGNACEVYNVWNAIISLKSNKSSSDTVFAIVTDSEVIPCNEGDDGAISMTVKEFLNKSLEVRGADAVRITYSKFKGYKKSDGAFSHSYTSTGTMHQGCPVTPPGYNIGDVDATCISSTGLVRSMFDAFGLGSYRPDFFGRADYYRFVDYLEAAKPIYKTDGKNLMEDFEDTSLKNEFTGNISIENGSLTVSGDADIKLSKLSTIGPSLLFKADMSIGADSLILGFMSGDAAILEFSINCSSDGVVMTNTKTGSYAVLGKDPSALSIYIEIKSGNGVSSVSVFENRMAIYTETFPEELPIKAYTDISSLRISTDGELTLDNMTFAILTPTYSIINDQNRVDFEIVAKGELNQSHVSGSVNFINPSKGKETASYALIISEDDNKFLRLEDNHKSGSNGQDYFEFKGSPKICDTAVFEARMRINTENSDVIPITVFDSANPLYYGVLKIDGGYLYAGLSASKSGRGKNMVKTAVKNNEWFTVRLEYTAADEYSEDSFLVSLYINDSEEPVVSSNEMCDGVSLYYGAASGVYMYRMACNTSWTGTIDYDDIFIGAKQDYKKLVSNDSTVHIHSTVQEITDLVEASCGKHGGYTQTVSCETCGETISKCYIKVAPVCTPKAPVTENRTEPSCYVDGGYDSVVYCSECGKEISRERIIILAGHKKEQREENRVESESCAHNGSYTMVVYCTVCEKVLSKAEKVLPSLPHTIVDGACTSCGATSFIPDGFIDFENTIEKQYASIEEGGNAYVAPESTTGSSVHINMPKNYGEAFIVSEDSNKYLKLSKTQKTNSNPWVNVFRDTSIDVNMILFETRIKLDYTTISEGIYFRMYTGRTDSTASDGKRLFTDRITATSGGLLAYRLGSTTKATHASAGEFATIRITLVKNEDGSFTRTFWLKNETDKAITYEGESYEVGEFIPYISGSTGYENTDKWSDVGDVNCVTFLPSSGHIGDLYLDDCYIGGEFRYVSK